AATNSCGIRSPAVPSACSRRSSGPRPTAGRRMTAVTLFDIPVRTIDGVDTTLAPYRGRVLLVVNVASRCGFTPQYEGLEALYRKHRDAGLVVLGFPCNQFLREEPGDEAAIKGFCTTKYDVTFPMFAKVDVNGPNAHPLYRYLKARRAGIFGTRS